MRNAFRSAFIITVFTFSGQVVLFVAQIITAAMFGASADMDAFLAANTLPQYVISVLLGSLGFVFIPLFIDYKTNGNEEKAYELGMSLFNNCILFLGIITILGILFVKPLLQITAPGLSPKELETGMKVAIITWPTIVASGALSLLSSIYQAEKKFGWQAAVPFIGAVVNLIMLWILARWLGVIGLAVATTCGVVVQVFLLIPILTQRKKYKFSLNWNDGSIHHIVKLVTPLILVAIVTKFTPIVDRYLASGLGEGSISHLNYAFKVTTIISVLISAGGATVIFPKMALDAATGNLSALRGTLSMGLRIMFLIIAPVVTIGISLSLPIIVILFNRGEFTSADSVAVASILKIYLFALMAMCLGNVTGKGFYVLKDTKTLAIFGVIETISYAVYTIFLTKWLGVIGIAIGYVIYFNISLIWQLLILNYKTGNYRGRTIIISFAKTILAAVSAGILSYVVSIFTPVIMLQIILGSVVGLTTFIAVLYLLGSKEIAVIRNILHMAPPAKAAG